MEEVQVFADWDADGVVSAAMVYYAQRVKSKFPLPGVQADVGLHAGGPRSTPEKLRKLVTDAHATRSYPRVIVFLDIPLTHSMIEAIKMVQREIEGVRIVYIDHHYSTLARAKTLYSIVEEAYLGHRPTAILVYNLLRSLGVKHLTPRLEAFMRAVGVLERSRKPEPGEERIVKLAASLSKATAATRDEELWRRLVLWLASPIPQPIPLDQQLIERVIKIAEESDRRIEEQAKLIAPTGRRVGFLKLYDVRGRWEGRGLSALASKLYKIVRGPVAVLGGAGGYTLLVIRAPRGLAYRMAKLMLDKGLAENIGGHGNIAVIRLKPGIDDNKLLEELRRISFEAQRASGKRRRGLRLPPGL